MNDAALGGLIDRGDHRLNIFGFGFCSGAGNGFLHFAQAGQDTAIAERADAGLAGAFGSGFRVSHWKKIVSGEGRGRAELCQDGIAPRGVRKATKLSPAAEARGLVVFLGPAYGFRRLFF